MSTSDSEIVNKSHRGALPDAESETCAILDAETDEAKRHRAKF